MRGKPRIAISHLPLEFHAYQSAIVTQTANLSGGRSFFLFFFLFPPRTFLRRKDNNGQFLILDTNTSAADH